MKPMSAFNIQSLGPVPKPLITPQQPKDSKPVQQSQNSTQQLQSSPIGISQQQPPQSQQLPPPIPTQPQYSVQFVQGLQHTIPPQSQQIPQVFNKFALLTVRLAKIFLPPC